MIKATDNDKPVVLDILTTSFAHNQSVNYIIKKGKKHRKRIRELMDYSFETCRRYGDIFISADRDACALLIYPEQKKPTIDSVFLDAKLIFRCVGFRNIGKVLQREAIIKRAQPDELITYLWFIGVDPARQGRGIGSRLLTEISEYSRLQNRPIYLETSTLINLPWYEKFGFKIYHREDLGYNLYFLNNSEYCIAHTS